MCCSLPKLSMILMFSFALFSFCLLPSFSASLCQYFSSHLLCDCGRKPDYLEGTLTNTPTHAQGEHAKSTLTGPGPWFSSVTPDQDRTAFALVLERFRLGIFFGLRNRCKVETSPKTLWACSSCMGVGKGCSKGSVLSEGQYRAQSKDHCIGFLTRRSAR